MIEVKINDVLLMPISGQSRNFLERLSLKGIYGRTPAEVAARFVDEGIQRFVEKPIYCAHTSEKKNNGDGP